MSDLIKETPELPPPPTMCGRSEKIVVYPTGSPQTPNLPVALDSRLQNREK